ncbi:MAG: hypothetical protein PHQ60_04925 [Sideroxydans sp.]|nr:hypothetical protein [Sideroxydans sp.]
MMKIDLHDESPLEQVMPLAMIPLCAGISTCASLLNRGFRCSLVPCVRRDVRGSEMQVE